MLRRIGYPLVFGAAAGGLVWAGWPGTPASLPTLFRRVDVIAAVVMLAGLPWLARRIFGPAGSGLARVARVAGYAAAFALVLVTTEVAKSHYAAPSGRPWLAGAWAGEIVFLVVLAVYVAGLLGVTARRSPAAPRTLAIGTGFGVAGGLLLYAVPPLGLPLHVAKGWQVDAYGTARVLAVLLALVIVVVAGLAAGRRTSHGGLLPLADARARQGLAAGLCAGATAALLVSILDLTTIALLPRELTHLQWAFTGAHLAPAPGPVYQFEMSVTATAAGHLLVLIVFPLLGAGLGAWGGLGAVDRPGHRPGGGGGGGGGNWPSAPVAPPPGGLRLKDDHPPAVLRLGPYVPAGTGLSPARPDERPVPDQPDRVPVGAGPGAASGPPPAD